MKFRTTSIAGFIIFTFLLSGCAAFRSDLEGEYKGGGGKNYNAEKVKVLFIVKHYRQLRGWDSIPKLDHRRQIKRGFNDLFIDACQEFSNLDRYTIFTDYSTDISDPDRQANKDSLIATSDYVVRMRFDRHMSFPKYFFSNVVSYSTLSVFPMAYTKNFSLEVDVFDKEDVLITSYKRSAHSTKWVQTLMLFIYPFHPEKRKIEEIYSEMMHDIFKQIEVEKVLK